MAILRSFAAHGLALVALATFTVAIDGLAFERAASPSPGQAVRDRSPSDGARTGTAHLSGRVVALDSGRPVKQARVVVSGSGLPSGRTVVTDEAGRYVIGDLPAGTVVITASKEAFLAASYGQRSWPGSGTPIRLADGQALDRIDVSLPRGGVVTGHIVDEGGEPLIGATVRVSRLVWMAGESRVTAGGTDTSDDRGEYRVFGLPPGTYYVSAHAKTDSVLTTRATGRTQGGGMPVAYGPTYYPSAGTFSEAIAVPVRPGQETHGIDLSVRLVPVAEVSGRIAVEARAGRVSVSLVPDQERHVPGQGMEATVAPDGTFRFAGVPYGRYRVVAREAGGTGRAAAGAPPPRFAVQRVMVAGQDVTGLTLALQRGGTVAGRVTFEAGMGVPPSPASCRILTTGLRAGAGFPPSVVTPQADGTFLLENVPPLPFLLDATSPVAARGITHGSDWRLKGFYSSGRDISDTLLQVAPGESISGVMAVFSDRVGGLNGLVRDGRGDAMPGCAVLAFSTDPILWRLPQSRYLRMVRTDLDGHFDIRPLPRGEYHVQAFVGIDALEWSNPDVLERLRDRGTRATVSDNEIRTIELRLSEGGRP